MIVKSALYAVAIALTFSPVCAAQRAATAQTPAPGAQPGGWAQLRGDLPVDPDVTLGTLPNGMRYVIQTTKVQPGRSAMRFVINAGSMHEASDQEGLAHFLEHMAFHGSKNVPDGEVQKSLERLGLRMGADTNASTGGDRTIYKFNLAKNDDASIDTGLMLFREIASELNLDPALMDKERGVVLAELTMRDDPIMRMQKAQFARQLGSHPYARSPGGRAEVIQTAPVQRMRDFYDAFYRPERATVVVAGDVDPAAIEVKIKARFSDWAGRGKLGADPAPVAVRPAGDPVAVEVIEGMPLTTLQLQWFDPYRPLPLTKAERRRQLVEQLGASAVSQRLGAVLEASGKPATGAGGVFSNRIDGVWSGRNASASGINDAATTLDVIVTGYRQAAEFGITQAELDRVIALQKTQRERGVASGQTAPPGVLADIVAGAAGANGAFVSARDGLNIFAEQVGTITLAEVNATLKSQFAGEPYVTLRGATAPAGGVEALAAAWTAAKARPLTAFAAIEDKTWPYTAFGPAGKVAERRQIADLGVTLVRFENGVRLTVKPNAFRKNDTMAAVRFGFGRLAMPRGKMDASDFGIALWSDGGLAKLSKTEQRRVLQPDFATFSPSATTQDNSFVINMGGCSGGCLTPDKVGRFMEVAAAMLTDPAWRTDDWATYMKRSDDGDKSIPMTARSVASWHSGQLIHGGDVRWAYNTAEMRKSWRPEDAVTWGKQIIASGPLEVLVVGDVKVDLVIAEVGRTLGALPARNELVEPAGLRDVKFPAPTTVALTHKGPKDQGVAFVYWPTTDVLADTPEHRRRLVLASIMTARLNEKLRGAEGKSYSPGAFASSEMILPGYGYLSAATDYPPAELDTAITAIEAVAAELTTKEVTRDEFERAIRPQIEFAETSREQNGYWMSYLIAAHTSTRLLDYIRTTDADYASITPADIMATAKRWLRPEKAWKMKVVPEFAAAAQ